METVRRRIPLRESQDIITTKVLFYGAERKHISYVVRVAQHKQGFI